MELEEEVATEAVIRCSIWPKEEVGCRSAVPNLDLEFEIRNERPCRRLGPFARLPLVDTFDPGQRAPNAAIRSFRNETGPPKTFGSAFGNLTGSFRQSHLLQNSLVPRIRVELIQLRSSFAVLQPSPSLLDRDIEPVECVLCMTS